MTGEKIGVSPVKRGAFMAEAAGLGGVGHVRQMVQKEQDPDRRLELATGVASYFAQALLGRQDHHRGNNGETSRLMADVVTSILTQALMAPVTPAQEQVKA